MAPNKPSLRYLHAKNKSLALLSYLGSHDSLYCSLHQGNWIYFFRKEAYKLYFRAIVCQSFAGKAWILFSHCSYKKRKRVPLEHDKRKFLLSLSTFEYNRPRRVQLRASGQGVERHLDYLQSFKKTCGSLYSQWRNKLMTTAAYINIYSRIDFDASCVNGAMK
jgi:hypothetical protein